ncbi:uncharacterized protein F4817DRAFT_331738 [Daldinia loculata]|uniref:uncharacterized protein n=1 Tax=Daldinia loculata TaxID=103429 RepID=UPI0020C43830|nr:uncharacterized protein F4817DRAFT_331738 [Daldinia loculata]KAI1649075.1 hypothetical protein F4817DRAFT_331738 [Daldinia loculata]
MPSLTLSMSFSLAPSIIFAQASSAGISPTDERSILRGFLHRAATCPSSWQFLHSMGGLSGQSLAMWPSFLQNRHSPVNSWGGAVGQSRIAWPSSLQCRHFKTRGLGHSALLWPSWPQLKQARPPPPSWGPEWPTAALSQSDIVAA